MRPNNRYQTLLNVCLIAALLLGLVFSQPSRAGVLTLPVEADRFDISEGLEYLIEDRRISSIDDVLYSPQQFIPYDQPTYNQGYKAQSHWIKFTLRIPADVDEVERLLEIDFPFLWDVDLYVLEQRKIIYHSQTGAAFHPDERPFEHANFVFPLNLPTNRDLEFYIHVVNDGPVTVPLRLWKHEPFNTYTGWRQTGFGVYFGIMLAMALYNFFLFLSIRTASYFWYSLHVVGIGLINVSISGFGSQFLWRDFPTFGFLSAALFAYFTNYFALHFTRTFLETKHRLPRTDRVIELLGYVHLILVAIFFLVPKAFSLLAFTILSLISIVLIFVAGILSYRKGQKTARYFLLAWGIFEISIAIKMLSLWGIIPNTNFTYYAVMLGSIAEGILLALALADKINEMKEQQAKADQKALRASEESNQLKDQFLATISHELRTPIHGIQGSLSLLRRNHPKESDENVLCLAQVSCDEMMSMVTNVLEFTEMQSGKLKLEMDLFNLKDTLEPVKEQMQRRADSKGIELIWEVNASAHTLLFGDAARLKLVVAHLVDNAVKFTEQGGVHVSIKEVNGHISGRVRDSGVGIDASKQSLIYQAFTQIETGLDRRFGGLGIGLNICQHLLALMGGRLSFVSKPNVGSEFSFSLSLPECSPTNGPIEALSVGSSDQALIVEDNPVNMQILCAMLERLGLTVHTANNGKDAVALLDGDIGLQSALCLILMDCQMPVMDGHEATRIIRQMGGGRMTKTPIIAVTANAMSDDQQKCLRSGMNDYLKKPVTLDDLERILQKWLPKCTEHPTIKKTDLS